MAQSGGRNLGEYIQKRQLKCLEEERVSLHPVLKMVLSPAGACRRLSQKNPPRCPGLEL